MMENGHGLRRAILYRRVSTREQVAEGYSLRQQTDALREYAAREGLAVLAEIEDAGYSGAFLDRPGLERVREIVAAGGVSVVLAQDRDRLAREPAYLYLLREEFASHGCAMRSLNDRGDGSPEGNLTDGILDQIAKFERAKTRERSRRGARRKVSEGRLLGASPKPRYGFCYNETRTGYVINPKTMPIVARIFADLANGHAINVVVRALDEEGVPPPRGGAAGWSRKTVRDIALNDTYKPHTVEELRGLILPAVLAGLDPDGLYGIAWSGRVKVRKVSNSERVRENPERSEWVGVPIPLDGSGLDAVTVGRARLIMQGNGRPSKVGDRFFELAHGPLRCAHCGCRMTGFGRRSTKTKPSYAYRCNSPSRKGIDCPNRRQHHAANLEYAAVSMFETYARSGALLRLFEEAVEEQDRRSGWAGSAERRAALVERLGDLKDERGAFLRLAASGRMSDDELDGELARVDEERKAVVAELGRTEDTANLKRERQAIQEQLAGWETDPDAPQPGTYLSLQASLEEIRRTYLRTGTRFSVDKDGALILELDPLQMGGR